MSRRSPGRKPKGLTIIELLVVVTCLAILAAILFPLFARVRSMSYRARCSNNLRQLGAAFYQYSLDWNGYWPSPGGLVGDRSYWSQSANGGLQSYVRQRGLKSVWCCPLLGEWNGKYPARSYSMNGRLREPPDAEYPTCNRFLCGVNTSKIVERARTVLLFEGIPLSAELRDIADSEDTVYNKIFYIMRCADWTWARGFYKYAHAIDPDRPWHGRFNNYLYCDGHIAFRTPGRRTVAVLSTYKEMRQWYVSKSYFENIFNTKWSHSVSRDER